MLTSPLLRYVYRLHENRTPLKLIQSHNGPIIVWVAKADTEGKGNAWVKIQEDGLSNGQWAVEKFRSNAGKIDVTVPDLAAGEFSLDCLRPPRPIRLTLANR